MHRARADALKRLRHSRLLGWVGFVLLLFQIVLATDHLGASAARAFGPSPIEEALGILSFCHGDGTVTPIAGSPGSDTPATPAPPCILCTVAAIAAVGIASTAPVLAPPVVVRPAERPLPLVEPAPIRSPLRYGTLRGPPGPRFV